jgi:hypothetical protein
MGEFETRVSDDAEFLGMAHPDRWDGHSFGIGEMTPWPEEFGLDRKSQREAAAALNAFAKRGAHLVALQTFSMGDVFDASDHEPGTIITADNELLFAESPVPRLSRDTFADIEADEPVTEFPAGAVELGLHDNFSLTYVHYGSLGVVARTRSGRPVLLRTFAHVLRTGEQSIAPVLSIEPAPPVIEVGKVTHHGNREGTEREVVVRDNIVRVVQKGVAQRKRGLVPEWLGHLRPETGHI